MVKVDWTDSVMVDFLPSYEPPRINKNHFNYSTIINPNEFFLS